MSDGEAFRASGVEKDARDQYEEQLESWLATPRIAQIIDRVQAGKPGETVDHVRENVVEAWADVTVRLQPAINRWTKAKADLSEAEDQVEERVSQSRLRSVGFGTLGAVILTAGGVIWVGVTVDPTYLFGLYLCLFLSVYWFILLQRREQATSDLSVAIRRAALIRAEDRFSDAVCDQVPVAIREAINKDVETFDDAFRMYDESGLRELADPEREVSTISSESLSELISSLDSGSIGLAGSRGAGKTTLIQSFATGRSVPLEEERIGLVVSAPVKYDALEFVLHLFGLLCKRVIGEDGLEERDNLARRSLARRRRAALARLAVYCGVLLALVGVSMLLFHREMPEGPTETGGTLLIVGVFGAYFGLFTRLLNDPKFAKRFVQMLGGGRAPTRRVVSPELIASERLEEISFQQSISSGWSAGLKLPFGLGLEGDISATSTRTPWSLPQAVQEFRKFASTQAENAYLVIGIDELDKMESDKAAREFLNDVKGVFGVPNCYYLVSVSEDAMSTFERRGLPFRDVFDSSFDAIQRVDFLKLQESRSVLESRVAGLPVPFQYLCHALAGGLPRDLIRVARDLMRVGPAASPPRDLASIASTLTRNEHASKMTAARATAGGIPGRRGEWLSVWLTRQCSGSGSSSDLHRWTEELHGSNCFAEAPRGEGEDRLAYGVREIAGEVAAFNYYAATLTDLFADPRLKSGQGGPDPVAVKAVETVAEARQQFSISPWLAWSTLDESRDALGFTKWNDPRGAYQHH